MPRITDKAKAATRNRIMKSACKLFKANGFERATTRDIAQAAQIATGTLFNYFPTKEDIVMALVATAFAEAAEDFAEQQRAEGSLEEVLFLNASVGLRRLKPHRKYVGPALETTFSPMASAAVSARGEAIRIAHLELVQQAIVENELEPPIWTVPMQLYWSLYNGVLAYWVNDSSPKQEDTLAMLDESMTMFVGWLKERAAAEPPN